MATLPPNDGYEHFDDLLELSENSRRELNTTNQDLTKELFRAISSLDRRERVIVLLFFYDDHRYEDIAHDLGLSINRVRLIIKDILNRLAAIL